LFWKVSDLEIWRRWTKAIKVSMVKIWSIESQQFQRYSLCKLGFLNNPENMFQTSQLVIFSINYFMWLWKLWNLQRYDSTCTITSDRNFKIKNRKLSSWWILQVEVTCWLQGIVNEGRLMKCLVDCMGRFLWWAFVVYLWLWSGSDSISGWLVFVLVVLLDQF